MQSARRRAEREPGSGAEGVARPVSIDWTSLRVEVDGVDLSAAVREVKIEPENVAWEVQPVSIGEVFAEGELYANLDDWYAAIRERASRN